MFLNGVNGFLKAERPLKMTNVQVELSVLTPETKINEIVRGDYRMSIRIIAEACEGSEKCVWRGDPIGG